MINKQKIQENVRFLGISQASINNTEKRSAVRKLLNGLGFSTADYIELTMPQLQDIYNGLLNSVGSPLQLIHNMTVEKRASAVNDFQDAIRDIDWASYGIEDRIPVEAEEEIIITKEQPKMKTDNTGSVTPEAAMQILMTALTGKQASLDENAVLAIVKREMKSFEKPVPTVIEITDKQEKRKIEGLHHYLLPSLIKKTALGTNLMLVGPAGSGKTTLAHQIAKALNVDFYFNGAISSEYKLTGFIDAQGRVVSTAFRKAYEFGGLYLFDEIDASMSDALLAFNAALANGHMDFPDGTIKRHEKFYCVAAANTFGKGADRVYVGRNCLDAASLNRFAMINIDYDERLERELAANDQWTAKVQKIRKNVAEHKIKHVVSPRASIEGAKWLANGIPESEVLEELVYQGMDIDSKRKIML